MPPGGEAFIRCAKGGYDDPGGEAVRMTIGQLGEFIEGTDACRRAFKWLDAFNYPIPIPVKLEPAGAEGRR